MGEPSIGPRPRPGPRVLPAGRYVALWAGVCVLIALAGALVKNYGPELGGDAGLWAGYAAGFVLVCLACGVIARRVGNPTAPIICGVFVGLAAAKPAEDAAAHLDWFWRTAAWVPVFAAVYFVWVGVIHPRLAGRRAS